VLQGDYGVALTATLHSLEHPKYGATPVHQVLGVASSMSTCGRGIPDLFTRAASHIAWIEDVVWPAGNQTD
jgi:hypothetical protein